MDVYKLRAICIQFISLLFILCCLLLFSCSHYTPITKFQRKNGLLIATKLSYDGSINSKIAQLELPYTIIGKSDILSRNGYIYIGSHERFYILKLLSDDTINMVSSLQIEGYDFSLASHPIDDIVYITNSEGVFVVNARKPEHPKLVSQILFKEIYKNITAQKLPCGLVGTGIACEDGKLAVTVKRKTWDRSWILVFDISQSLNPNIETALDASTNANDIVMTILDHRMIVIGDQIIEYRDFKKDPNSINIRYPEESNRMYDFPGHVVEAKFSLKKLAYIEMGNENIVLERSPLDKYPDTNWEKIGFKEITPQKIQTIVDQYRDSNTSKRLQLCKLFPLDHGFLYIATEHSLIVYNTTIKNISFMEHRHILADKKRITPTYFYHIYGIDTWGNEYVYLAGGKKGIYVCSFRYESPFVKLKTDICYDDMPLPVLDVCIAKDNLYILCGELK